VDEQVHITLLTVDRYLECNDSNQEYAFFSTKGIVRLEIRNLPFDNLSYSIVTAMTGNHIFTKILLFASAKGIDTF